MEEQKSLKFGLEESLKSQNPKTLMNKAIRGGGQRISSP